MKENIPQYLKTSENTVIELKNEWGFPTGPYFTHVGNGRFAYLPREHYHRTTCRECGFVGTKHGVTNNVEYITVEPDPGHELAHVYCSRCDKNHFVGNEPCPECDGWKEPEPTRSDDEDISWCDCSDEEE
tara:strand:- start:5626 stop:6015 length:390 start_codon:yes stop_codon:yes gene_type:complete